MKIFPLLAPARFLSLVKQPKIFSHIKIFDTFFRTLDKIPPQLLKSLVVSMPKRVFEVNREKLSLHYISSHVYLKNLVYQMVSHEFFTKVL